MSGSVGEDASHSPRFLADENIRSEVVEGLQRQRPQMIIYTAAQARTLGLPDLDVLLWAKNHNLILITHDRHTMPQHFADLLMSLTPHEHCPGVFVVSQKRYSIGQIIGFLVDIYDLSSHEEWQDRFINLPL